MKNRKHSLIRFIFVLITFISLFLLPSCNLNTDVKRDASTFDEFANNIFHIILDGDDLSCNYLFNNLESFGLEKPAEVSLPTPSNGSLLGTLLINYYFSPLKQYDYNELNSDQQMTYLVLLDLIEYYNETNGMGYLKNDYLGSYLGYQAQLPILLAQYNFNSESDVITYMSYLSQMKDTFNIYVNYEVLKGDNGYGMSDFVIDKVIDQCESFILEVNTKGDNHFLIESFNERIDKLDLEPSKVLEYKNQNEQLVRNDVVEAYQTIIDRLPSQYGRSTNDYGLCYYDFDGNEIGKKYYSALFKKATGYDMTPDEGIEYLDSKISSIYNRIMELRVDPSLTAEINTHGALYDELNPGEILESYISEYSNYFPELSVEEMPNINVLYVDESMEDHYSPASYIVSAIDNTDTEVIYLNNKSIYDGEVLDYSYLYPTLAHEGFPGHMYQNIYFKNLDVNPIRKVLKNSGYVEGWATYAEYYSYNFIDGISDKYKEYLVLTEEFSGLIQTRCDLGIHWEGWKETEVEDFLGVYYSSYRRGSASYNSENAVNLIHQLVEIPTNSVKYFIPYLKLCDLHDWAMTQEDYNEIEFHKYILDCGPLPLRYVEEYVKSQYYTID